MASLSVMTPSGSIKTVELDGLNNYVPQKGEVIMFDGRVEDYNFEISGSDLILTLPNGEELVLTNMADMLAEQDEDNPTKVTIASGDEGDVLVLDNFGTLTEIMDAAAAGDEAPLSSNVYQSDLFTDNDNSNLPLEEASDLQTERRGFSDDSSSSRDRSGDGSSSTIQNDSTLFSETSGVSDIVGSSSSEDSSSQSAGEGGGNTNTSDSNSDETQDSSSTDEDSTNTNDNSSEDNGEETSDTTAPNAPIINNMVDTNGDMSEIILSGTADEVGNTITVYDQGGTSIGTTIVQADGTWSLDVASLNNDTDYTLKATQTDSSGNESGESNSVNSFQSDYGTTNTYSSDDYLFTGSGNDSIKISADDANDKLVVDAGDGTDTVKFSNQTDDITVNLGDDEAETIGDDSVELRNVENIYGGSGDDILTGDNGSNLLYGDSGDDTIDGGEGTDYLYGGSGDDIIEGGEGNDTVAGGNGADILLGGAGDDSLHGQNGDDTITGGAGDDTIRADGGTDTVVFSGNLEDYNITYNSSTKHILVEDTRNGSPDGIDDLYMVEYIQFADQTVSTTVPQEPTIDLIAASDTGDSNTDNITSDTTPTFQVTLGTSVTAGYVVTLSAGDNEVEYTLTQEDVDNGYAQITTDELGEGEYEVSATITSLLGLQSDSSATIDLTVDISEGDVDASFISIDMDISQANVSSTVSGESLNLNGYNTTNLGDLSSNANIDSSNNATNGKDYIIVNDIAGGANINSGNGKDILQINGDITGNASYDGGKGKDTLVLGKSEDSYTINNYTNNNGVISAQIVDNDTNETLTVNNIEDIRFTDTNYEYTINVDTQLFDTDGSESLSFLTLNNLPTDVVLKDSEGEVITANDDGSYSLPTDSSASTVTIVSSYEIDSEDLNSFTATATSSESNGGDELTIQSNIDGYDSLIVEDDTTLSFSELEDKGASNLEEINMLGGTQGSLIEGIEIDDVLAIAQTNSDDEQIMKIVGDSNDEVKVDTSKWEKAEDTVVDDSGNEFNVYQGSDESVKLYIDTDVIVTDI